MLKQHVYVYVVKMAINFNMNRFNKEIEREREKNDKKHLHTSFMKIFVSSRNAFYPSSLKKQTNRHIKKYFIEI